MSRRSLHIILVLLCSCLWSNALAQKGYMTVKGKVVLHEKSLQGAKVTLIKNGSKIDETLTNSNGKYTFTELGISPEGDIYIIRISKPGHIAVKHWISTKAPDERKVIFPDYFPEVELFKKYREVEKEKALSEILDKPISKFSYSVSKGDFGDDRAYFSTIKARVGQLFEILDAEERERKRLLAEYRLKILAEENKLAEEANAVEVKSTFEQKYEQAVNKADISLGKKKYRKAMTQYKAVMVLVSKSGLSKLERDKLKKHPKRKIYDLETLMAGLSEEQLDELEKEDEIAESKKIEEEQPEGESIEVEEQVVSVEEPDEETEVVEEISESEAAKIEAEKELPDALERRDIMLEEKKEEVALKRKENIEVAAAKMMISNAEVKQHEVAVSIVEKEVEVKENKNKEVVARRNQKMITMLANVEKSKSSETKMGIPAESFEERPKVEPTVILASTVATHKGKKNLQRSVVIVHNRIKVKEAVTETTATTTTTKKPVAKVQPFRPKSVQYTEESFYKIITNTIIKYPVKQDTLQHVDYLWGASYYFMNAKEIDEDEYNKVLDLLK